jgi:hypothetical protein
MRRNALTVLTCGALALGGTLAASTASQGASGTLGTEAGPKSEYAGSARIIDRTLRCSTLNVVGSRWITVTARAPVRGQKTFEGDEFLSSADVSTGYSNGTEFLAGVRGGAPGPSYDMTFWFRDGLCKSSVARVRLSTQGLSGGAADPFGVSYRCMTRKLVLVRIQGVFRSSTSLRRNRRTRQFQTRAHVERGALAITTTTGKPLAYLSVSESRRARIFTAPSCVPT